MLNSFSYATLTQHHISDLHGDADFLEIEQARISSHFMKWLTSQVDCNIYTTMLKNYSITINSTENGYITV